MFLSRTGYLRFQQMQGLGLDPTAMIPCDSQEPLVFSPCTARKHNFRHKRIANISTIQHNTAGGALNCGPLFCIKDPKRCTPRTVQGGGVAYIFPSCQVAGVLLRCFCSWVLGVGSEIFGLWVGVELGSAAAKNAWQLQRAEGSQQQAERGHYDHNQHLEHNNSMGGVSNHGASGCAKPRRGSNARYMKPETR